MRKGVWAGPFVAAIFGMGLAVAQEPPPPEEIIEPPAPAAAEEARQPWEEYDKLIKSAEAVGTLGNDLFGDRVNLSNGALSFSTTDVSLPGNSALPVAITRTFAVSNSRGYINDAPLGDWDLDLPRLSGVFAPTWISGAYGTPGKRCSVTTAGAAQPPVVSAGTTDFHATDYWQGNHLSLPGGGGGEMLLVKAGVGRPSTGGPYYWVTSGFTYFACLSTIQNGTGEGFLAITAGGTKYWFDWMAQYVEPRLKGAKPTDGQIARRKNVLYATRVEDRFGHWVTYTFTNASNAPARLTKIDASDGRRITLAYNAQGHVGTVSDGSRTWAYEYTYPAGTLTGVVLPDASRWTIDFAGLSSAIIRYEGGQPGDPFRSCLDPGGVITPGATGTITHPSGASGAFSVAPTRHGRTNVPEACANVTTPYNDPNDDVSYYPVAWDAFSLTNKRITGPGLSPVEWTYSYLSGRGFGPPCSADSCAGTAKTTVTGPNSDYARYTFGNSYHYNEGKLLKVERGTGPDSILSTETTAYQLNGSGQPYPATIGTSPQPRGDAYTSEYLLPSKRRTIAQGGASFDSLVNTYDGYANPASVTRSSSLGHSKTELITYHHNTAKWVLGQIDTVKDQETGLIETDNAYDATTAQLTSTKRFGKLQASYTYHTNAAYKGQLATVIDGRNNVTHVQEYKRGIPQRIVHAYGNADEQTIERAVVNDLGEITSVTDENANVTGYEYDPMGRLKKITYPTGDSTAWNATTISFAPSPAQYGLPAGHWRQIVATGNARKIINYDALWRPLLTREYDTADPEGTARFTSRCYDHDGRETFVSYPLASAASVSCSAAGTRTTYDALGRTRQIEQDSESGVLTTTIDYLHSDTSGSYKRITNPRNYATRIWYQAFDTPSEDAPVKITDPGGQTDIVRDDFGKPKSIKRSGTFDGATVQQTRTYVYRPDFQELCKIIEAETGASVLSYDEAGNLAWATPSTSLTSPTECNLTEAAWDWDRRIWYDYDAHNRLKSVSYPTGAGNRGYTYWPDGLLKTLTTTNPGVVDITTSYAYNKRRLPTVESLGYPAWDMRYYYNANGHRSLVSYPDGVSIEYAMNALGQPTKAGSYASGITYHPNGALKQFTYGNGLVHRTDLNTRQLPSRIVDYYPNVVLNSDLRYSYDANGNVADILDVISGGVTDRGMVYDGVDRLTQVEAPDLWGTAVYRYDPLDNLRQAKLGSRDYRYVYSSGRLSSLRDPAGNLIMGFGYDPRGNRTSRTGQTYVYDHANRLGEVVGKEWYGYDGHGRRVLSCTSAACNHQQHGQDGKLYFEIDNRRNKRRHHVHLGGRLLAILEAPETGPGAGTPIPRYQHVDALGSPVAETNPSRTVTARTYYAPYGEATNRAVDGPGYTGHLMDAATGLVYMQQRYYDPGIGRFLSVDPVTADGNTGGNFNRYWYANNNPYRFTDPDGRAACPTGTRICYDSPRTERGTTPQAGPSSQQQGVDKQVRSASRSGRLSDGTRLNHSGGKEQGFSASEEGTKSAELSGQTCATCSDGSQRKSATFDGSKLGPGESGGHTHDGSVKPLPGPEDGGMARITGKTAYVISPRGAFGIEKTDVGYRVRLIDGAGLNSSERGALMKTIDAWNQHQGGSGITCTPTQC